MTDSLKETMDKALALMAHQRELIERYSALADAQTEGMNLMSEGMLNLTQVCAKVAELTDDPEILHQMRIVSEICEGVQKEAKALLKDFDEV